MRLREVKLNDNRNDCRRLPKLCQGSQKQKHFQKLQVLCLMFRKVCESLVESAGERFITKERENLKIY